MDNPNLISVAIEIGGNLQLYKLNKTFSLEDSIADVCLKFEQGSSANFALKIVNNDGYSKQCEYLTESSLMKVLDGAVLKLCSSAKYMVSCIFTSLCGYTNEEQLKWLKVLSRDPVFVAELRDNELFEILQKTYLCRGYDLYYRLLALSNIYRITTIQFIDHEFVQYLIRSIKSFENDNSVNITSVFLELLGQIITKESDKYFEFVTEQVKVKDLVPNLWREENMYIQFYTLILLNKYVELSGNSKYVIEELDSQRNKTIIFKYVIPNALFSSLAHELYVYQTYILGINSSYLDEIVRAGEYENVVHTPTEVLDFNRRNSTMDFEEKNLRNRRSAYSMSSQYDLSPGANRRNLNRSQNSIGVKRTASIYSNSGEIELRHTKLLSEIQPANVCKLTMLCLDYYKKNYKKNYMMSTLESNHEPGFYIISDQITNILVKILHIGLKPDSTSINYHPLAFLCVEKKTFVGELFCRALWLLARTRREMRAKTVEDHDKVLLVLESQIQLALEVRPTTFMNLTESLKNISYQKVFDIWEKEKKENWEKELINNPCIQELKKKFMLQNEEVIRDQRISILQKGGVFPKYPEKKGKRQYWRLYLLQNKHKFVYGDWDVITKHFIAETTEVAIQDINYVVSGNVCPHVKNQLVRKELNKQCFSLLLKDEGTLDFVAKDEIMAQNWVDGFHSLLDKPMTSDSYKNDLETLSTMDLKLQLLDVQDIPLPQKPPPIPPLPVEYRIKPPLPFKSQELLKHISRTTITLRTSYKT